MLLISALKKLFTIILDKSIRITLIKLSLLPLLFSSLPAIALQQVLIEGNKIGQGFIVKHLNQCFFIAPEHVIKNSMFLTLKGDNAKRSLGDGIVIQSFGYDLAIGSVEGQLAKDCDINFIGLKKNSDIIETSKTMTISTINADGLASRITVNALELSLTKLLVKPSSATMRLFKGMSGSIVYAGEVPVGMLQSVDSETGNGRVLRIDRLLETVAPFFNASAKYRSPSLSSRKNPISEKEGVDFQITSWNLKSRDSTSSPSLIKDNNKNSLWEIALNSTTLELELTLEKSVVISGLTYHSNYENKASIKTIEILTSKRNTGKRGWISQASYSGLPNKLDNSIQWSPSKVKRIKLRVYDSWRADFLLHLNELIIY